jgi:signal transduction histidine kinase
LFHAIAIFAFSVAHAQNGSLYFNHLTVNNGLSQSVATVTLKDSRGFIWIASLDGIDCFDGISCRHYDLSHLTPLNLTQTTTNFLEDQNGDIWAGTQHGLLKYSYKKDAFSYHPLHTIGINNDYASPDVVRISYIDADNNLWLQRENYFYCFDINKMTSRQIAVPPLSQFPRALFPYRKPFQQVEHFYVMDEYAARVHKASRQNGRLTWASHKLDISLRITNAAIHTGDTIFLAAQHELYRYHFDLDTCVMIKQLPNAGSVTALTTHENKLWVGTSNDGIVSIDIHTNEIIYRGTHSFYNDHSLLADHVPSIFIDDADNLWVSAWGQGISYTNLKKARMEQAFTNGEAQANGCSNFIRCIAADSRGDIWCSTGENYLVRFDSRLQFREKIDLPGESTHFVIDKSDNIWFGSNEDVFTYSIIKKRLTPVKKDSALVSRGINNVMQLKNGQVLFACNYGVWTCRPGEGIRVMADLPYGKVVNMLFENKEGMLFVGIDRVGMNMYEPSGNNRYRLRKTFTFSGNTKCFYEQNDTALWIATTTGLMLFNQQKEKIESIFTTANGFPNNYLYACLPDAKQNLWITSNKGITAFNMQTRQCRNFNVQDGIQSNEFNSFAYLLTRDSAMIFGGINGLNRIKPSSFTPYNHLAKPQITSIKRDSMINPFSFDSDKAIILPYDKSGIEIGIAALEYANAASNTLKYILEGNDKDWSYSPNKGLIQYAHLAPGKYRFKLMAANCDGVWNPEIRTLHITVLNPFWLTWWFMGICVLVLSAALYLIYRFRLQQALKMERLRTRIATDLHDDIGSTLSSISMYSEAVKKQVKDRMPQLEQVLEKMGENSRKMVSSMSDIVWAVNPGNDEGKKLLERMEAYATDACSVTDTRLHFSYNRELNALSFPLEYRKNIYLIFKEALNNALKYAEAGDIYVSVHRKGTQVNLVVQDNGKGFDTATEYPGNGLKNLQLRAREIQASLKISSCPGKGTLIGLDCNIS